MSPCSPSWPRKRALACAWAVLVALAILAYPRTSRAEPGDELTVSVLTFGPGDHPFSKFGHDGLLLEDRARGTSLVFNYGTYSFGSVWLIPKFLLGKYRYWLSVSPLSSVVANYAAENRTMVAQRLRLTAAQKRSLAAFLHWNAREENKYYVFDYYRDNCATRVRDLVDKAAGGALRAATTRPAALTWRQHTERLTADDPLVFLGLDIAMGGFIDQPITVWQEMFLPERLEEELRRTSIETGDGLLPLVESETVILTARRPPMREYPPRWTLPFFAVGTLAGLVLAGLGWSAARGIRAARIALGFAISVIGLLLGLLGCLFLFLWIFTNHEVAYRNENILQCAPFAAALAWQGIALARGRARGGRRAHYIVLAALACSAAGLAFKLLPWSTQHNAHLIALFLPLWVGMAAATRLAVFGSTPSADRHRLAVEQARRVE